MTPNDPSSEYQLIEIPTKPRSAEKIRDAYYKQNISPVDKAIMRGGSEGVRKFYNDKNLRQRLNKKGGV